MCIYLYQKYKRRNPNTNTEGDPVKRLSWLLAGLGPEGSAGSRRARQGAVPPGSPRHVGHKGALASLGHHEMQGTGSHVLWWRGGPSGTAEHPGLLKATGEGPASDPDPSSLRGQHLGRPGHPSSQPSPSTLIPCSELILKCCGILESVHRRLHRLQGLGAYRVDPISFDLGQGPGP